MTRSTARAFVLGIAAGGLLASAAPAQVPDAGALREHHPQVASLLESLDAAHERIHRELSAPGTAPAAEVDRRLYERVVAGLLPGRGSSPVAVEPDGEGDGTPATPTGHAAAHSAARGAESLRRRIYELYADPAVGDRWQKVEAAIDDYLSAGTGAALPVEPKDVEIAREASYAGSFAEAYPRLSGLLRAHRWLQLAVHEPLIEYESPVRRHAGLTAVTARFWQMLENPPETTPRVLPLAPAIAPALVREHPRAAAIFDNLHLMDEVMADALVGPEVTDRRAAMDEAVGWFMDSDFLGASWYDWNRSAILRGVGNQGGWATGFLPRPERTPMGHDDHGGHMVIPGMPPGG